GGSRRDRQADAALLGAAVEDGALGLVRLALSSLLDELIDRGHGFTSFLSISEYSPREPPKGNARRKLCDVRISCTQKERHTLADKAHFNRLSPLCQTFEANFRKILPVRALFSHFPRRSWL